MIRRVLAAIDGSTRSFGVLEAALEIAERFGVPLLLLRAITIPPEFPAAAAFALPGDPLPARMTKDALGELEALVARDPRAAAAKLVVREGSQSWRTVVETADELDVDLIVIGSHGYHGFDRVLGTNASKVANHAHRNVLVVHERSPR